MEVKYLYGASVQGIQDFIFQTSKLTEIVGASELVEQICTSFFKKKVGGLFKDENLILGAAGNIKYIFDNKESCQQLVKKFPKAVMEMAPGITISQAVVEIKDGDNNSMQILEDRLRIQRNKFISITNGVGLMVTEISRKTGGTGVEFYKGVVIDKAQLLKNKASEKANLKLLAKIVGQNTNILDKFPFDLTDMLDDDENKSWIAVIHADGNNLGQLIMKLVENAEPSQSQKVIRNFSNILNAITEESAKLAFEKTITKNDKGKFPFRPVILGGDDLTAIVKADLALSYTKVFLMEFEVLSKAKYKDFQRDNNLSSNPFEYGLTACAGIAYIKASYPFHYGISLSESLCKEAKTISKNLKKEITPSSLMFHKVYSSFVEEYEDIIDAELTAKDNIQFNYGPYFVKEQYGFATIDKLEGWIKEINRTDAPKVALRNWLTELKHNTENANQLLERIASLNYKYVKNLLLKAPYTTRKVKKKGKEVELNFTPIFDIMMLSNISKISIHE
jgi:hypothetical protein